MLMCEDGYDAKSQVRVDVYFDFADSVRSVLTEHDGSSVIRPSHL